jgi:catechol 2,3-dioxygenase-like lactoylglutathione lyase family enzyme
MAPREKSESISPETLVAGRELASPVVQVRYLVNDVAAAIQFYRDQLGFAVLMHPAPAFAMLQRGGLRLVLSQPNPSAGGGQPMPDGTAQTPGGWNRFAIEVDDLQATVVRMSALGARFRNQIVTGVGGRQVIVEDPSGNPVELFEPTILGARLNLAK